MVHLHIDWGSPSLPFSSLPLAQSIPLTIYHQHLLSLIELYYPLSCITMVNILIQIRQEKRQEKITYITMGDTEIRREHKEGRKCK